jgi:hypothetical protein
MAGGPLAEFVPCWECLGATNQLVKATRILEGVEDDQYACPRGHKFGMDWRKGPADEAQWPPPQDMIDELGPPLEK